MNCIGFVSFVYYKILSEGYDFNRKAKIVTTLTQEYNDMCIQLRDVHQRAELHVLMIVIYDRNVRHAGEH